MIHVHVTKKGIIKSKPPMKMMFLNKIQHWKILSNKQNSIFIYFCLLAINRYIICWNYTGFLKIDKCQSKMATIITGWPFLKSRLFLCCFDIFVFMLQHVSTDVLNNHGYFQDGSTYITPQLWTIQLTPYSQIIPESHGQSVEIFPSQVCIN